MRQFQAREQAIITFARPSSHATDAGSTEGLRRPSPADSVLDGARYPAPGWFGQTELAGIVVASFCRNALL
jgi:hypothetical protein